MTGAYPDGFEEQGTRCEQDQRGGRGGREPACCPRAAGRCLCRRLLTRRFNGRRIAFRCILRRCRGGVRQRSRRLAAALRRGLGLREVMIILSSASSAARSLDPSSPQALAGDKSLDGHSDVVDTHAGQVSHPFGDVVANLAAGAGDVDGIGQVQGDSETGRAVVDGGCGAGVPRPKRAGGSPPPWWLRASRAAWAAIRATTVPGIRVAPRRAGAGRDGVSRLVPPGPPRRGRDGGR